MTALGPKDIVLKENEIVHDACAHTHTRSVPYQSRKITRNYIWSLIKKQLQTNGINAKNAEVLEVACGTGTFVNLFRQLKAKSYDGIDISSKMIEIAKQNNKYNNVNFYTVSLEEFSQNNGDKYDIIIASSFLHHLTDLEEGLLQIKKMLKPNGIFIALHEVINNRELTKLEKFDNELSFLFAYQGHIQYPLKQRIKRFFQLNEHLKTKTLIKTKITDPADFNWVDYQLNFDFNLAENKIAQKYGKVIPYCYYSFAELRYFKNIENHKMLIMKKEANNE